MKRAIITIAAACAVLLGFLWLHSHGVWVTIQTQDQRDICRQMVLAGTPDRAEQYQSVWKF